MGFRTVAIARGQDKAPLAKQLGASHYIDSQSSEPAAELTKLGGAKVVLATVTHGEAMGATVAGLAPHGKLMVLGAAHSLEANPLALLMGRRSIEGWYSGTSIDSEDTLNFSKQHRRQIHERNLPLGARPRSLRPHDERQGPLPRRPHDRQLTSRMVADVHRVRRLSTAPGSLSRFATHRGSGPPLARRRAMDRLQFLIDLHTADEDRAYLSGTLLPQNEVWVAQADTALAGFIAFSPGWVNQLYVAPAFQGQGIGTKLLAIAQRRQFHTRTLGLRGELPAIHFYQRRGFHIIECTNGANNEAKRPDLRMQWFRSSTSTPSP